MLGGFDGDKCPLDIFMVLATYDRTFLNNMTKIEKYLYTILENNQSVLKKMNQSEPMDKTGP